MSHHLQEIPHFRVTDHESGFEVVDLTNSSADCPMENIKIKKPSESLSEHAHVYDPESSFEVIDDSADCSMELVEEASEDTVKRDEAEILTSTVSEPLEDSELSVKSSESSNTEKRLWKLAKKLQKISGSVENFEAARNEKNSRPILEEIGGFWKLISQEVSGKEVTVPVGDCLKIKVIGNSVDISTIKDSKTVKTQRRAHITSKHLTPKIKKTHDYIDQNQWYTVVEKSWNVKQILNGQLVIEYQTGEKYKKEVFERTQHIKIFDVSAVLLIILTFYLVVRFIASPIVDYVFIIFFFLMLSFGFEDHSAR